MGTGLMIVYIVVIIGVLVALALIFKDAIGTYATKLMEKFFNSDNVNNTLPKANVK